MDIVGGEQTYWIGAGNRCPVVNNRSKESALTELRWPDGRFLQLEAKSTKLYGLNVVLPKNFTETENYCLVYHHQG